MSEEKTPTEVCEGEIKTASIAMRAMAGEVAKAATAMSELAKRFDRIKSIIDELEGDDPERPLNPDSHVTQLRLMTGDSSLQIDYTDRGHPVITTKCNARMVESLTHEIGPVTWSRITVQPPAEEKGPTIAERLKAGEIDFVAATNEVTSIIMETLESTWGGSKGCTATSSPSTTPRHIRVDWAAGESTACFTIYNTGKATTGGKDADLWQVLRDILESEGFDVRP